MGEMAEHGSTSHALVVGGSGMLAGVVHALSRHYDTVSVIARGPGRLRRVAETAPAPSAVAPISVDYEELSALDDALAAAVADRGALGAVVGWIRTASREPVWRILARHVAPDALLVDVKGSTVVVSGGPDPVPGLLAHAIRPRYRRVVLGFKDAGAGRTRWLTDGEIASGVIDALRDDCPVETVVGRIEPWHDHP